LTIFQKQGIIRAEEIVDEQVTLTAYADQVRELIRNDRNDEAIAICKHILRYYPKYLDAYRQLGEALLEKGRQEEAKDLFRRVLSADPENVAAYAGLAVILEQEQLVAEATWHMERAYELSPANLALHQELHRLYYELDGRPRARLKLTPGALARLYIQEGLYAQAIQELSALVAQNEARFDARVALAETLWQVGQMRQAAEVAQALLKPLPYCLKANLILGTVWKETGLAESEQYLQRAQELDPTNQVAQQIFGARSPLPPLQPRVPRYVEGAPAPTPEAVAPSETITIETPAEPIREPEVGEVAIKPPVFDTTLPPWLLTPMPELGEEKVAPLPPTEPSAAAPVETAQPEMPQETPDWLAQLRQAGETVAETPAATEETVLPPWTREETKPEPAAATPSWIEEIQTATETPAPQEEIAPEETSLPSWIAQAKQKEEIVSPVPEAPAPEVPAWLSQLMAEQEPAKQEPKPPESREELPTWISQPTPPAPAEPARESREELPAWMSQPTPPAPADPPAREELPAWASQPTPPAPAEPARESREELPAWMSQPTPPAPAEPARESREELPTWISQPTPPAPAEPAREELPAWVSQPTPPAPAEPAREELPAWMSQPRPPAPAPHAKPPAERKRKPTARGDSHLILARAYRDANQIAEALREYDYIVQKAPRLINQVIADLEVLSKQPGVPLDAHRILGDAYTRADRLAEALEEYRFVLGRVAS
jgi:tetratricopeptide (TPR) repeat protein